MSPVGATAAPVLQPPVWRAAAAAHHQRVLNLLGGSITHDPHNPIFNFIFEYYSFNPKLLVRWSPGPHVRIADAEPKEPLLWQGGGWRHLDLRHGDFDPRLISDGRRVFLRSALGILEATARRPAALQCYGLHEWAMLYKPEGEKEMKKHQRLPLRVTQAEVNQVVESHTIACTHFDAVRFFAPAALPLNTARPTPSRETQPLLEQPGCLHANMDLFKYAVKLFPHLPAELLADALEVAIAARLVDMRASPYDLQGCAAGAHDLSPIRIETALGRKEYQRHQSAVAHRAAPVRRRLIQALEIALAEPPSPFP